MAKHLFHFPTVLVYHTISIEQARLVINSVIEIMGKDDWCCCYKIKLKLCYSKFQSQMR